MTERWSSKLAKLNARLVTGVYLCGLISASPLLAQSINISPDNQPLDQQSFQKELDRWMLSAYEGDRNSQFQVAMAFISDQMVEPDYEQAVYWYKQAARQGHIIAQYNLGHQYMIGQGVQKSERLAMGWWQKAARQGHSLAQFNLGRAYYLGIGVDKNEQQSRFWFEQAALNQEPKSLEILQQLGWDKDLSSIEPIEISNNDNSNNNNIISDKEITQTQSNKQGDDQFTSRIVPVPTSATASPPTSVPATQAQTERTQVIMGTETSTSNGTELLTKSQQLATTTSAAHSIIKKNTINSSNEASISDNTSAYNQTPHTEQNNETKVTPDAASTPIVTKAVNKKIPLAVYTNPAARSILIGLVDDINDVIVINNDKKWVHVQSSNGLPAWIHSDFLEVLDSTGTVKGINVNARAVPLVIDGSKVGKLNDGDKVTVLESRNNWHRVISPPSFKAWAKVAEYNKALSIKENSQKAPSDKETIAQSTIAEKNRWSRVNNNGSDNNSEGNININSNAAVDQSAAKPIAQSTTQATIIDSQTKPSVLKENDNHWLFAQAVESYTLQLASFDDEKKVNAFLERQNQIDNDQLHRFTATSNGINWTYFLYGNYSTTEAADKARKKINLPKAWIRNFKHLTQNRCISWKKQLPPPKELKRYCLQ